MNERLIRGDQNSNVPFPAGTRMEVEMQPEPVLKPFVQQ
jgi:hypothetical protein